MMKLEIPTDNHSVMYHMGEALRNIAIDGGFVTSSKTTVVSTVGEISRTVTNEMTPPPAVTPDEQTQGENPVTGKELKDHTHSGSDFKDAETEPTPPVVTPEEVEALTSSDDTYDKEGLPWDNRIHSKGKTRNADDTWRVARCPKDKTKEEWESYIEEVRAELTALMQIESTVTEEVIEAAPDIVELPEVVEEPPIEIPEIVTPPVTVDEPDCPKTFGELMKFITTSKLPIDKVKSTLAEHGIPAVPLLAKRLDLIPQVYTSLKALV